MWDPFLIRSSNSDRSCLDPSPPNTILGLHDIPLGVKQQALRPSISPLLLLTLLYYDPWSSSLSYTLSLSGHTSKLWFKWQNKNICTKNCVCLDTPELGGEGLGSSQGRLCVPRKKEIGLASFAFSPPSIEPLCQASFSRGCQMGRWKQFCGQS